MRKANEMTEKIKSEESTASKYFIHIGTDKIYQNLTNILWLGAQHIATYALTIVCMKMLDDLTNFPINNFAAFELSIFNC